MQKALQVSLDETDEEFSQKLEQDSNAIAAKFQLHSALTMLHVSNMGPPRQDSIDSIFQDLS